MNTKTRIAMKKWMCALPVIVMLFFPLQAFAQGSLLQGKMVTQTGTIEGILHACTGQTCIPGREDIVAAAEDEYVLVVGKQQYFYLPNLKSSLLSPHIGETVRVKGVQALDGNAIIVKTAEALIGGEWSTFYSPEIAREAKRLQMQFAPVPAPEY